MKPDGLFYWLDSRLPDETRLSPQDKYVWTILNSFTDDDGQCYMSMDTLAKRAGICIRMTQYSMKNLRKTAWVQSLHQTSLRTTLYQLKKPEGYQILHPMAMEDSLQPPQKPEGYQILQGNIPNLAPNLCTIEKKEIVQVPKREIVHKRETVSHVPKITFNRKTHLLEYDDKARLTFDLDFPDAGFDKYIEKVHDWIVRTGKIRLNYWKSLCSFVTNDRKKQNPLPLLGYVLNKEPFTDEERKRAKENLLAGFGDGPDGDDPIQLMTGKET